MATKEHRKKITQAQRELRNAFADGNIARAEEALFPKKPTWKRKIARFFHGMDTTPASLSFIYEDDSGCQPVHYLCGEISPRLINWSVCGRALRSLFTWFFNLLSPKPKPVQPLNREKTNDELRASLLCWLIERGQLLDFSLVNLRGENPLHCCAKSGSSHVLRTVLGLASTGDIASDHSPCTGSRDFADRTPLDTALSQQHWTCVRILCYHGALRYSPLSVEAKSSVGSAIRDRPECKEIPGGPGMIGMFSTLSSAVSDVFGNSKAKVKRLERRLERAGDTEGEVRTLTGSQDLEQVLQGSVGNVMSPTGLSESGAAALLAAHNYDERAAIEAYSNDPTGTLAAAGLSCGLSGTNETSGPGEPQNCIVCFDQIEAGKNQSVSLTCGHPTCDDCWRGIIRARLDDGDVHHTVCPTPDCNLPLPMESVEKLASKHQSARFKSLLFKRFADSNPAIRWCPRPGCSNSIALVDGENPSEGGLLQVVLAGRPVGVECTCGHRFCWVCLQPAHEPAACNHVREWQSTLKQLHEDNESRSVHWLNQKTQMCPKCHSHIQRNGGCNHMQCTVCQQHFCYKCGRRWDGHNDFFQCSAVSDSQHNSDDEDSARPGPSQATSSNTTSSVFSSVISRIKSITDTYWWEWYMQQYSAQDTSPEDLKKIGKYMMAMLNLGCPQGDEGMCVELGTSVENKSLKSKDLRLKKVSRKSKDITAAGTAGEILHYVGDLRNVFETIESMVVEICLAREVLQNSYIMAFNMKRGSRKKYLENMQSRLSSALEQLSFVIAQFPGFSELVAMQWVMEGKKEDLLKEAEKHIRQIDSDIMRQRQFFYCMAIASFNTDLRDLSSEVHQMRCNITKSARLGLLHKRQPPTISEQVLSPPPSQQPQPSSITPTESRGMDWITWLVKGMDG
ncbi:hypothetical protein BSKO_10947 [Bryopsis sp. KO-2023]|nr:hypothetical protein BSKO_10947 [Bryopsis sp. KO-2023]